MKKDDDQIMVINDQITTGDLSGENEKRTIYRIVKNKDNPYVQINKTVFDDCRLSMKAKGLHGYMLTKPDNWRFHRDEILNHCTDKQASLKAAIKELVTLGYLYISEKRSQNGKFAYWETSVYETPELNPFFQITENQDGGFSPILPQVESRSRKSTSGETSSLSKAESRSRKSTSGENPSRSRKTTSGKSTSGDLILFTNNKLTKNNNNKELITTPRACDTLERNVVVNLDFLIKEGIGEVHAKQWVEEFTEARCKEVVEYVNSKLVETPKNKPAYIYSLLKKKAPLNNKNLAPNNAPVERKVFSRSENLVWFRSLPVEQRNKFYDDTVLRISHLPNILSINKIEPLSEEFLNSTWFKDVMETAQRFEE